MNDRRLSWGLAVTTYQRQDMLARCVTQALAQTRPASEIVIVDSSPGFEASRQRIASLVRERAPGLRFEYALSALPNQPAKRNEAVRLATADVLFMIDDDSLMYPNCAERVMAVYETPGCESVVGVMTGLHPEPPDRVATPSDPAEPPSRFFSLAGMLSQKLKGPFHPPCLERPEFPTPAFGPGVRRIWDLHGARLTVRRRAVLEHPFDGALLLNAHEDRDAAVNLTKAGVLAEVGEPLLCHLEAPRPGGGERRGFLTRGAWLLNYAYLARKWCPSHPDGAARTIRRFARAMLALDAANALRTRSFSRVRGVLFVERAFVLKFLAARYEDIAEVLDSSSE
jgi:hypothetical protein